MSETPKSSGDRRMNYGLVYDITQVLEQHGFAAPKDERAARAMGRSVRIIYELTRAYEGIDQEDG